MNNPFRELRDRLETVFADLLRPDLKINGADRVHVVMVSETDLTTCGEFAGLHSPRIHRWLRSYIPRWNGPAPTMLIDDATISRDCDARWDLMAERFISICTHELAHVVCTPRLFDHDDESDKAMSDMVRQAFVESVATKATFYSSSPRVGHGVDWLRACLHITHRMQKRGWDIYAPQVIDSTFYSLSSTSKYRNALGDEPSRLSGWPVTSIPTIPPPQQFLDQWNSDLAEWPDGSF